MNTMNVRKNPHDRKNMATPREDMLRQWVQAKYDIWTLRWEENWGHYEQGQMNAYSDMLDKINNE